ncbi:hypothetical protein AB0H73_11345 [Streptomyces olivoreticuli]|nr:hypothetical protein [Streptomyces olivoreticuli]
MLRIDPDLIAAAAQPLPGTAPRRTVAELRGAVTDQAALRTE